MARKIAEPPEGFIIDKIPAPPEGFVLDEIPAPPEGFIIDGYSNLPEGFVIDKPTLAGKLSSTIKDVAGKSKEYALDPRKIMQDYLGGEKKKRATIKDYMSAKPERPYGVNIAGEFLKEFVDFVSPEMVIASGLAGGGMEAGLESILKTPQGMKLAQKYLPNLLKGKIDPIQYEKWLKQRSPTGYGVKTQRQPVDPVVKITQALKPAKRQRAAQEALYTLERTKRAGKIEEAGKVGGLEGYIEQLKAAKGEMPKVEFEGKLKEIISQADVESLLNRIEGSDLLRPYEKLTTKTGLLKLLGVKGTAPPVKSEIKLLEKVFPADFMTATAGERSILQKVFKLTEDVINIPKAIMASGELSGTLRQAFFLTTRHPIKAAKAFPSQVKYFFSEKAYQSLKKDIKSRPTFPLMRDADLSLTDILTGKEEKFISNMAERIPILGKGLIRPSDRAFTGYLNKLRADVFDHLVKKNKLFGNPLELKGIATVINNSTGRGSLPQILEGSAKLINGLAWSPRLQSSRIALLNPAYYTSLPPVARKEALQVLASSVGTVATVLGLVKANGHEVGLNPFSSDFLKIKLKGHKNTRFEITAGMQQYLRGMMQFAFGKYISSSTGVETRVGEGYKPLTRLEIAARFLETKGSPVASFALGLLRGKNFLGKDFDIPKETGMRFVSMIVQDAYDLFKEGGFKELPLIVPAIFGIGVQTYSPDAEGIVSAKNSVKQEYSKLLNQGKFKQAEKLRIKNKEHIEIGSQLEPYSKNIKELERQKKLISENVLVNKKAKKEIVKQLDSTIKLKKEELEERHQVIKASRLPEGFFIDRVPPPPKGFVIDSIPPPPEGFVLD